MFEALVKTFCVWSVARVIVFYVYHLDRCKGCVLGV